MKLITKEIERRLEKYPIRKQQESKNPVCILKFFNPCGAGTWYVTGAEKQSDGDWLFFGYVELLCNEWGYFSLNELKKVKLPFGLNIERDLYFEPKTINEIKRTVVI